MFNKISEGKLPTANQYIAFKSGDKVFVGIYVSDNKASPFCMESTDSPIFLIDEWFPIHLWI